MTRKTSKLPAGPLAGIDRVIARICDLRGWSQAEVARRIGIDRSQLSRKLSGAQDMRLRELDDILAAASLDARQLADLLDEVNDRPRPTPPAPEGSGVEAAVDQVVDEMMTALERLRSRGAGTSRPKPRP